MVRKVKVIDAETKEELRESYYKEEMKFFGFSIPQIFQGIFMIVTMSVFLINSDANQKAIQLTVSRLTDFRDNSDNFNTLVYKTKFKNGEPADPSFKIPNHGLIGP